MAVADIYTRQQQLKLTTPHTVTVVGCGGIGSWVAILSAMSGVKNLTLFDPDVMEESNRNRLPFCQSSLNRPKVEVVQDYIMGIRPEANVIAIEERLDGVLLDIQMSTSGFIVDCTDSPKTQFMLYNRCKAVYDGRQTIFPQGPRYIRAGYDGTNITVTSNVSGWIKVNEEEEAYVINPSWVVPAVVVAALAVGKMMKYQNQEVSGDIGDIGIAVLKEQAAKLTPRCTPRRRT